MKPLFLLNVAALQPIRTSVFTQQKRFRGKINIQKPRPPHHERGKIEKFTLPFIPNPAVNLPLYERCLKAQGPQKKEVVVNPYEQILAREVRHWFSSSTMIGIFHVNSIKQSDLFDVRVPLKRANMIWKYYQKSILRLALTDTRYEPLFLQFCDNTWAQTHFVFSTENNISKLMKITKMAPQIILMAGLLHGKLLSRNEFLEYGKLDLVTAQAGLVQVLRAASGGNLNRQLTHHQSTLVTRLGQIGTKEEEDKPCDAKE